MGDKTQQALEKLVTCIIEQLLPRLKELDPHHKLLDYAITRNNGVFNYTRSFASRYEGTPLPEAVVDYFKRLQDEIKILEKREE